MNYIYSVFLGIVQGLTEFLPVSSSAHLVLFEHTLPGFSQPGILFDVILHAGTTFAVIMFFMQKLLKITLRELVYLFVATLPAVIIGVLFREVFLYMFSDVRSVGYQLIITGVINILLVKLSVGKRNVGFFDSWIMGIAQAIAIIPGISRSGLTIFSGSLLKIDRKKAAEFSFLMSVPAIFGANALEIYENRNILGDLNLSYVVGFLAAFLAGYLSIGFLIKSLQSNKYAYFGVYCVALGALTLLLVK